MENIFDGKDFSCPVCNNTVYVNRDRNFHGKDDFICKSCKSYIYSDKHNNLMFIKKLNIFFYSKILLITLSVLFGYLFFDGKINQSFIRIYLSLIPLLIIIEGLTTKTINYYVFKHRNEYLYYSFIAIYALIIAVMILPVIKGQP